VYFALTNSYLLFVEQKLPVGARSSDPGRASPARKTSVSKGLQLVH